jgi:peptide-methionine (S)-S-oxide reductase
LALAALAGTFSGGRAAAEESSTPLSQPAPGLEEATFASGCFWCTEKDFDEVAGVVETISGYTGGRTANPTYEQVCSGATGHAEVVQITFDPLVITYPEILEVFWSVHDPTTLNRQGADIGTQYRSVVFYHDEAQKVQAEEYKKQLDRSGTFKNPVVTEISPMPPFYKAEKYHQNYFNENGNQPYCTFVVRPKVEKFQKEFKTKLKD